MKSLPSSTSCKRLKPVWHEGYSGDESNEAKQKVISEDHPFLFDKAIAVGNLVVQTKSVVMTLIYQNAKWNSGSFLNFILPKWNVHAYFLIRIVQAFWISLALYRSKSWAPTALFFTVLLSMVGTVHLSLTEATTVHVILLAYVISRMTKQIGPSPA
jgi:hypothetical protein